MGESLCLLDSNILLRWAQDHDPDYAVVSAALNALRDAGQSLCYTSQNLGSSGMRQRGQRGRTALGFRHLRQTSVREALNRG